MITLDARDSRLPYAHEGADSHRGDTYCHARHRKTVASHERACAIPDGVRLCANGPTIEPPLQIVSKLLRTGVAAIGLRAQRHQHNGIQFAAQRAADPLSCCHVGTGVRAVVARLEQTNARACRRDVAGARRVRSQAGQKFVQHHTE